MKVRVTRDIAVFASETVNVLYEAGFEGTAPKDHIDRIVAAGAGERIGGEDKPAKPESEAKK